VQKFVDDNPMEYDGKELKAYTTGLGMMAVLMKKMIDYMMSGIVNKKDNPLINT